jgi:hypothetical protein
MEAAAQLAQRLRAAANERLAGHEPLLLAAAPLFALLAARAVHAAAGHVADRGLRAVLITLAMAALKYISFFETVSFPSKLNYISFLLIIFFLASTVRLSNLI